MEKSLFTFFQVKKEPAQSFIFPADNIQLNSKYANKKIININIIINNYNNNNINYYNNIHNYNIIKIIKKINIDIIITIIIIIIMLIIITIFIIINTKNIVQFLRYFDYNHKFCPPSWTIFDMRVTSHKQGYASIYAMVIRPNYIIYSFVTSGEDRPTP